MGLGLAGCRLTCMPSQDAHLLHYLNYSMTPIPVTFSTIRINLFLSTVHWVKAVLAATPARNTRKRLRNRRGWVDVGMWYVHGVCERASGRNAKMEAAWRRSLAGIAC